MSSPAVDDNDRRARGPARVTRACRTVRGAGPEAENPGLIRLLQPKR